MKNLIKTLSVLALVITFSCDQSDSRFSDNPESGWIQFTSAAPASAYFNEDIVADQTASIEVPVMLTAPINKNDLMVSYSIVNVTGTASEVISTGSSVTFPANTNELLEPLTLNIDLAQLELNVFTDYIFDVVLTGTNSSNVKIGVSGDDSFPTSYRVTMSAPCMPPTVGGMYSMYTEYGFHDFLPDFSNNTMDMEVVDLGGESYFVQDFSGGLYDGGPYTPAYGTGPTSIDVTFNTVCDDITWSGQVDPWGDVIPLDGGDNFVDPGTGVLTISWFCTGYGENGVSVYTPL